MSGSEPVPGVVVQSPREGDSLTLEPTMPGDEVIQLWAYNAAAGGEQAGVELDFRGCTALMLALASRMQRMRRPADVAGPDGHYPIPEGRRRYEPMVWLAGQDDGWTVWDYATRQRVHGEFGPTFHTQAEAETRADELNAAPGD